jgi:hypothetical protein
MKNITIEAIVDAAKAILKEIFGEREDNGEDDSESDR